MNQGKYIFNQLTNFLPQRALDQMVEKYDGNKYVKFFILEPIILHAFWPTSWWGKFKSIKSG